MFFLVHPKSGLYPLLSAFLASMCIPMVNLIYSLTWIQVHRKAFCLIMQITIKIQPIVLLVSSNLITIYVNSLSLYSRESGGDAKEMQRLNPTREKPSWWSQIRSIRRISKRGSHDSGEDSPSNHEFRSTSRPCLFVLVEVSRSYWSYWSSLTRLSIILNINPTLGSRNT